MHATYSVWPRSRPRRDGARGMALLALLLALGLGGIVAMAAVDVWSIARQRAQEQELLFIGDQYRQAIRRYYFGAPPGAQRMLPARIEDLLDDDRYPMPVHHLRRRYADPIVGTTDWGLILIGDRLAGIHSTSDRAPVKQAGFSPSYEAFAGKDRYRDWIFAISPAGQPMFVDPASVPAPPGNAVPPGPDGSHRRKPS